MLATQVARLTQQLADLRSTLLSRSSRLAVYTTATRPSASAVPEGTGIYDTTLNKPIWSDGATWRDAAGTAV